MALPVGQSTEVSLTQHQPGVYRHVDTGAEFITSEGEEGVLQADALLSPNWHGGWERVGDVPSRLELLELNKKQALKDAKAEKAAKDADEKALA